MAGWGWGEYVPVAQRRANALREMDKLRAKGVCVRPIVIQGRTIAKSFWGKGWCEHLETFSDFENRLPRGRTYVRNGSVCHLDIRAGRVEALVSGTELYKVAIGIKPLNKDQWERIKQCCAGEIGSLIELLQGKLSEEVMGIVTQREQGLFPLPDEIDFRCSCPDIAYMCKHVAAVLYGVGSLLDAEPGLLFTLRDVDPEELIGTGVRLPAQTGAAEDVLSDDLVADLFGIELDTEAESAMDNGGTGRELMPESADIAMQRAAPPQAPRKKGASREFSPTGKNIARLRKKSGKSVADFAKALGVTAVTVYRWEETRGKINLQARNAAALAALHNSLIGGKSS